MNARGFPRKPDLLARWMYARRTLATHPAGIRPYLVFRPVHSKRYATDRTGRTGKTGQDPPLRRPGYRPYGGTLRG